MGCRGQAFAAPRARPAGRPLRGAVGGSGGQGKAAHQPLPHQPLLQRPTEDIRDRTLSGPGGVDKLYIRIEG